MLAIRGAKAATLGIFILLLALVLACGEESTPTPTATAPPTATTDVAAAVHQAVQQAIAAMPTPAPGVSAEDIPSVEDISSLVQAAVASSVPEGTTPEQIQAMVQAAVSAAAQPGVTRADLEAVVSAAVEEAVEKAVAQITPVATPTATPATPTPEAMVGPSGTLNVAVIDHGPLNAVLYNQDFQYTQNEIRTTQEGGLVLKPDGSIAPRLVTSFETSADGLTTTYHLREGVPWHDGFGDWGNFTADDFIMTMEHASKEGSTQSSSGAIRNLFTCAECTLTAVDEHTIRLERPSRDFTITWELTQYNGGTPGFHSKRHFDAKGEAQANKEMVGTGPWEFVEDRTGELRRYRGVADHWRRPPDWNEMVWWVIQEESTRLANFLAGQLDTVALSTESVQAVKDEAPRGVKFANFPGAAVLQLRLHGSQYYPDHPAHQPGADGSEPQRALAEGAAYTDVCGKAAWVACDRDTSSAEWEKAYKVRLAMEIAIDRQQLVNNLGFGAGRPWHLAEFQGFEARMREFGLDELQYPFDPARGRELLAEAGYASGFEIDVFLVPRGPGSIESAQAVANMLRNNLGITVNEKNITGSVFRPQRVSRGALGFSAYKNGPTIEPIRLYDLFYTPYSSFNQGFEHPDYQALVDEAKTLFDDDARFAKQAEIARWIFDNAMHFPLWQEDSVWPLGPEIDQWAVAPQGLDVLSNWEDVPHRQ